MILVATRNDRLWRVTASQLSEPAEYIVTDEELVVLVRDLKNNPAVAEFQCEPYDCQPYDDTAWAA